MKIALIGHTGFVGSNLKAQGNFTHFYNSSNIEEMRGQHFDTVWCAGVRSVKWWANKHPNEDLQSIITLKNTLNDIRCEKFIHISTVDVFLLPLAVDENTLPTQEGLHAYGLHRLKLEQYVTERFQNTTIIRLPGLFGCGLKKNVIYDLLHNNEIEKINPNGTFQFYDVATVYADCLSVLNLPLVHMAVEPCTVCELSQKVFKRELKAMDVPPAIYDMHTCYATYFGKTGSYMQNKAEVFEKMRRFVTEERETLCKN